MRLYNTDMIIRNTSVNAEALFGSAARHDGDHLSDLDYLIVDDDVGALTRRSSALEACGFSVASYTYRRLERMAIRGSLFIQHLKDQSVIIKDDTFRLRNLINGFIPKRDYSIEIDKSVKLMKLASSPPDTDQGVLWASDILYVSLRNFGVLYLAGSGKYEFSYPNILCELSKEGVIASTDVDILSRLREYKNKYRCGRKGCDSHVREDVRYIVSCALVDRTGGEFNPFPVDGVFGEVPKRNEYDCGYIYGRAVERWLISAEAKNPRIMENKCARELRGWLSKPREYGVLVEHRGEEIVKEVMQGSLKALQPLRRVVRKSESISNHKELRAHV